MYTYTYSYFRLMYDRNQTNTVNKNQSMKKIFFKKLKNSNLEII